MSTHEMRFTTGQFAQLHHINKRTLHYYDSIGLFSPACIGENGYRYYTYLQSAALEMLLTLRELNMSIEEIDCYMKNRSPEAFHKILVDKTAEIDGSIRQLREIRRLLAAKEEQLRLCEGAESRDIAVIDCPEEYLLLSRSITGAYDDGDFAVFVEHAHALHDHRLFNKSYGSMIAAEQIRDKNFEEYACFFTRIERPSHRQGLFVKPAGRYLRAFCKGSWEGLPAVYGRIVDFAAAEGLSLQGCAYEEGLNEMAIASMAEYITQITILCEPSSAPLPTGEQARREAAQ